MAEYTGNFSQDSSGAIWGVSDVEGKAGDYESWDWKQIKAAVVGVAGANPGTNLTQASTIANPQSLADAAITFQRTQNTLVQVADALKQQALALTGENGPWSGKAATSFGSMLELFAAQLNARADQIGGGASGTNPVPQQLWDNAEHLRWAQNTMQQLDSYYADWAQKLGARVENGVVYVSSTPAVVTQLTEQMKKVIRLLAANYSITVSDIVPPDTSAFNNKPELDDKDLKNLLGENKGGNEFKVPPLETPPPPNLGNGPGGDGLGENQLSNVPPPPSLEGPELGGGPGENQLSSVPPPPSFEGPELGGGPGDNQLSSVPPPPPFGGPGLGGGAGVGGGIPPLPIGGPGGSGLPKGNGSGNGLPELEVPEQDDLGAGLGDGLGNGLGDGLGNGLGDGLGDGRDGLGSPGGMPMMPPPMGGGGNPQVSDRPDAAGLIGGESAPWDAQDELGLGDPVGLETPAGKSPEWAAGVPDVGAPGAGGMPMMPPPMGGGGNPQVSDRPDAAGLIGGESAPWDSEDVLGLGDPEGRDTPAGKSPEWAAGGPGVGGMPMMPPPMGGGGNPQVSDRPDAAGLIGGERAPWDREDVLGLGDPEGRDTPAGKSPEWAAGSPAVGGMPMMPPPMGGGGNPQVSDRPDAAGLIGGESAQWTASDRPGVGDPDGQRTPAAKSAEWAAGVPVGGMPAGTPQQSPSEQQRPSDPRGANRRATDAPESLPEVTEPPADDDDEFGLLPLPGGFGRKRKNAKAKPTDDESGEQAMTSETAVEPPAADTEPPTPPTYLPTPPAGPPPPVWPSFSAEPRDGQTSGEGEQLDPLWDFGDDGFWDDEPPLATEPVSAKVALVRPRGGEDTSAWNGPFLGFGAAPAAPAAPEEEPNEPEPPRARRDLGVSLLDNLSENDVLSCGGPDELPPGLQRELIVEREPEPEEEEEEETTRHAADLLSVDGEAWAKARPASGGVLE